MGQKTLYASKRDADWPLYTGPIPKYYRPLRNCPVQEMWRGRKFFIPYALSVSSFGWVTMEIFGSAWL
jgi:hypothetical protein